MNEYDSNRISDLFKANGYLESHDSQNVNCYILNTCHIREKATEKVYSDIGRLKKNYRNKTKPFVFITGCVAQAENKEMIRREPYIDAVIGPQSYQNIPNILSSLNNKTKKFNLTDFDVIEKFDSLNNIKNSDNEISAFLTIQEGCDKFCKFCVVPYTRGAEYSRSIKEVILEAKQLVDNGAREITLLGQNVNAYNYENKKLSVLINEISKINNLQRIRYSTSHPLDFSKDLIKIHKDNKKLMPLIHLPVQSGSNQILKAMNRKHTIEKYLDIIRELKEVRPDIKFSSDFIIGYPGETDNDFEKTLFIMNNVKFINSFSFIYSARPGTPAFNLEKVNQEIAKERLITFQKAAEKIKLDYRKSLINKTSQVLFENKMKTNNKYFGRDEFFNSVIVESNENLQGKIKSVKILNGNQNTLFGKMILHSRQENYAA